MNITNLRVPDYLYARIGSELIEHIGSSAVVSMGISQQNYFEQPFGIRYAFIYTYCFREDHNISDDDVSEEFIRNVLLKERAASLLKLIFMAMSSPPWCRSDGGPFEFDNLEAEQAFRKERGEYRREKLQKILRTLSIKDLKRIWGRLGKVNYQHVFLQYCPKEILPLLNEDMSHECKTILEKRLKGV